MLKLFKKLAKQFATNWHKQAAQPTPGDMVEDAKEGDMKHDWVEVHSGYVCMICNKYSFEEPKGGCCQPLSPSSIELEEKYVPPDDGDICWQIGSETFTRKEVFHLLWTQRAMISNDIKSLRFHTSFPKLELLNSKDVYEILENSRKPIY